MPGIISNHTLRGSTGPNASIALTSTARILIIGIPAANAGSNTSVCVGGSTIIGAAAVVGVPIAGHQCQLALPPQPLIRL